MLKVYQAYMYESKTLPRIFGITGYFVTFLIENPS